MIIGKRRCSLKGYFDLQGQLAPSGVLAGVLPSGQQPNSLLSQEDLSSAVGRVVLATVGPGGDTQGFIIKHEAPEKCDRFEPSYLREPEWSYLKNQASVDRFNVCRIKTFCFVPTRSCFCRWSCVFGLLTCDWTLIEASVRSDYMAFSWELILHLEVVLAGEHIMGTVASHVTHRALKMMTGCDNCSLLIG